MAPRKDLNRMMDRLKNPKRRNVAEALFELLKAYDLEGLANNVVELVKQGYSEDVVWLRLQDQPEWKRRFKGNELRKQKGLPVLSPQEYLATERSFRQVLQQYGMPKGFYDQHSDFAEFIGNDMSPTELQGRVQVAVQWTNTNDDPTLQALRRIAGIGKGELAAYALDQDRALPLLERTARAVQIGAEAVRQGLDTSRVRAEELADMGVSGEMAAQGYRQIGNMLPSMQDLGSIYGEEYDQETAEDELFGGDFGATDTRRRLASQERATWSGSSRGQAGRADRSQSY